MTQDFSNLNTGAGQPGITGPGSLFEVQQTGATDQTTHVKGPMTKDSIEKASELVAALYLPPMSNPLLTPPDPNLAVAIGQLEMDKICLSVLDEWSKSLQKIAEDQKEADRKAELNPVWREIHVTSVIFLSIASIFIRAVFGNQAAEAIQKNEGFTESGIAKKFAGQLAQWAIQGTLKGYLMTIVDQLPSSASLAEAQKTVLANQIQVMLLSSALAGLYVSKTGWITSEEFIHLLSNPGLLKDSDAAALAMIIVNTLSELPEIERARMARTLTLYMDRHPELPTLLDLGKTTEVQMSILKSSPT